MRAKIRRPSLLWRGFVLGGVTTMGVLSFNDDAWEAWEENVSDALPRSTVRAIFYGTIGVHVAEALLVRRKARRAGLANRGAWTRTALLYGFPTMFKLRKEIRSGDAGL
jgi:hypothetical protein